MTALDADLGFALGVIFRALVRENDTAVGDLPGGHRGFQILTSSAMDPPVSQSTLCHRFGIDRTVMTYLVDDLEAEGLVFRMQDPADRRARLVCVTDKGRARLRALNDTLERAEEHVLSGLAAADRKRLKALLGKAASRLNELYPATDTCSVIEDLATRTR